MVYKMTFPVKMTEEERMLKAKYAVLRKKKNTLDKINGAGKKVEVAGPAARAVDPKFAKLMACRKMQMARSGVGKTMTLPVPKTAEKASYKRPSCTQKTPSAGLGYEKYKEGQGKDLSGGSLQPSVIQAESSGNGGRVAHRRRVYPSSPSSNFGISEDPNFASDGGGHRGQNSGSSSTAFRSYQSSNDGGEVEGEDYYFGRSCIKRTRGPTIFISGQKLTELKLTEVFGEYGKILKISLPNPVFGFVTYGSVESAVCAIRGMDDKTVDQITYKVEFADRQPTVSERIHDVSTSDSWSVLATSSFQKSRLEDRRQQVNYDEDEDQDVVEVKDITGI